MGKPNILDFHPDELKDLFITKYQIEGYRAMQVYKWLYKPISGFSEMKNIPLAVRETLEKEFDFGVPEVVQRLVSTDSTEKYLLKLQDNHVIEAVRISYERGDSLCISTQVGCKMACVFCASGANGFIRNMTAGEILGQIIAIVNIAKKKITGVSLMGTGEPLDNFDNVIKFMQLAHLEDGLNIGYRHFSLSTSGLVPKIKALADLMLQITLCISLHSPFDDQRTEMMPINKSYPLNEVIKAVQYYIKKGGRRVSFEYAMIKGLNDSLKHAEALAALTKGVFCHVNLIPLNKTDSPFQPTSRDQVEKFKALLTKEGVNVTVRRKAGEDVAAACGQLRRRFMNQEKCE